jgi:class 3 adenylate cyclase/predicted ATPase
VDERDAVVAYLPRHLTSGSISDGSSEQAPRAEQVEGTLLFADVSGFTRLSERLARVGRAGAEEMVGAISRVFSPLVAAVEDRGGDVLKFSGDALFVVFRGPDHLLRGASAAAELQRALRTVGSIRTRSGVVRLSMSQGLHSGTFWLVRAGTGGFRDLVAVGPDVAATFALETAAHSGEVLLGPDAARRLSAALPDALREREDGLPVLHAVPAPPPGAGRPSPTWSPELERHVPEALRGRLADAVTESEHRTVSVAFVQFTGCDAVLAQHGPAAVVEHLDRLVDATTELARRHRVTVVCVDAGPDGGKLMLATGAPDSDERDAEAMLLFCLELVDAVPGLTLRAGVNRGPAYAGLVGAPHRFTYSTMGDAVNVAARLSAKAAPGRVVAAGAVLDQVGARFAVEDLPPLALKGKAQPVRAGVVRAALATAPAEPAAPPHRAVPFVGRAQEVRLLLDALARAADGHGGLIELVGPPGVGKSRLLQELERSSPPRTTLRLRCERHDQARAYASSELLLRAVTGISPGSPPTEAGEQLLRWLREHAPALLPTAPLLAVAAGAVVPPTPEVDALAEQFRVPRMGDAVEELLTAAVTGAPSLLVVEDAGLMDQASRGLLRAALRGVADLPWLVVTARRPGETGLGAEGVVSGTQLAVPPLDTDEASELARAAGSPIARADVERLVTHSAGNPLFLLELVRAFGAGAASMPDSVEGILAARIDRLPLVERRLLRYAAVLGERVDPALLVDTLAGAEPGTALHQGWLAAQDPASWRRLEQLLPAEHAGRVPERRFEHELLRRVAYEALPFARRAELHARAGRALEAGGSEDFGLLAAHFDAAGQRARTWRYASAAAEAARGRYAHDAAADLYAMALRAARDLPDVHPEQVAQVAERLGDSAETAGRYAQAGEAYAAARRRAAGPDLPRLLGKAGRLGERTGRYREALGWYTRGLRATADLGGPQARAARVELLVGRAGVRYRQGRYEDVVATCREVVAQADEQADRAALATACFLLDAALTDLGRLEEAAVWRQRALPVFVELGDLVRQADVLNNLGIDAYYEGRLDEALRYYERSRAARTRAGDVVGAATAVNNVAEVLSDQGRLAEAEEAFVEALAVWSRAGYPVGVALALSNLGRTRTRQGRPAEALPLLEEALARFRDLRAEALAVDTEARLAEARLAAGDPAAALAICEDLLGPRARTPGVAQVAEALEEVAAQARAALAAVPAPPATPQATPPEPPVLAVPQPRAPVQPSPPRAG